MYVAEVGHAILQVAHVAEEVLGGFAGGLYSRGRGEGWAGVCLMVVWCRCGGWRVSGGKCRDHDEEESSSKGHHDQEIRVQTDESVGREEGECVCRRPPREEADEAILEDKDDANASVEAAEVVGHQGEGEGWSGDVFAGARVDGSRTGVVGEFLSWDNLLENSG